MKNNLPEIYVGTKCLRDVNKALRQEWVVTNGLGGYASSTVLGVNTRKYHGFLVAAFNPPVDRRVLLFKLDEEIVIENECHPIGLNEFEYGLLPRDYSFLSYFLMNPFPTYRYSVHNVQLEKTVFMVRERNATVIRYWVCNPHNNRLTIRITPLVNSRHFHSITRNVHNGHNLPHHRSYPTTVESKQKALWVRFYLRNIFTSTATKRRNLLPHILVCFSSSRETRNL